MIYWCMFTVIFFLAGFMESLHRFRNKHGRIRPDARLVRKTSNSNTACEGTACVFLVYTLVISLRAGSLCVLFARVSWLRSRDLRAASARRILAPFFSPARKSWLRRQGTRANNTPSEPTRRLYIHWSLLPLIPEVFLSLWVVD